MGVILLPTQTQAKSKSHKSLQNRSQIDLQLFRIIWSFLLIPAKKKNDKFMTPFTSQKMGPQFHGPLRDIHNIRPPA